MFTIDYYSLNARSMTSSMGGSVIRDIVDGKIRQHPRCDLGDIFSFDLDVELLRIFLILNWFAVLGQVLPV